MTDTCAPAPDGPLYDAPAVDAVRAWPAVSVIMPVLNEARHLASSVTQILAQQYCGDVELVLALGPSKDDTDRIARELAAADPRVVLVRNPSGRTPAGLNIAVQAASHGIVARVDGHGMLLPGYLERAVSLLESTGAANVGGLMMAVGDTGFEQAVAQAYSSKVGLGGGSFHVGGNEGPADSVYLGVFRREVLELLGGFDEHYHRAQDWELNHRIRQAGGSSGSPRTSRSPTGRARPGPSWSGSSSTPAGGGGRSSGSTRTRCGPATSRRRPPRPPSSPARWPAWSAPSYRCRC